MKEQEINNKRDCTWFHFWEESIATYFIIVTITVSCEIINLCFSATKKFFRCCGCWIASNQLKTVFEFEFFLFVFKKFSMFFWLHWQSSKRGGITHSTSSWYIVSLHYIAPLHSHWTIDTSGEAGAMVDYFEAIYNKMKVMSWILCKKLERLIKQ